jgi:hypothetical protein
MKYVFKGTEQDLIDNGFSSMVTNYGLRFNGDKTIKISKTSKQIRCYVNGVEKDLFESRVIQLFISLGLIKGETK